MKLCNDRNKITRTAMLSAILACAVLAACGKAPAATPAPAATETPAATEAPAATETPAVSEEPVATEAPDTSEPATVAGLDPAAYTFADHTAALMDGSAIPDATVPVYYGAQVDGGWEAVAAATGLTVEELQAMNPDAQVGDDGSVTTYGLLLAESANLQEWAQPDQTLVSWTPMFDTTGYVVPADLDDQAKAAMAEGIDFLYQADMSRGYWPAESVSGNDAVYHSVEGARFTKFSELEKYMNNVFTPELAASFICTEPNSWGYLDGYKQGEDDSIWFTPGDRGGNIMYMGTVYTSKMAPTATDGACFGMLSLECAPDAELGSGVGAAYYQPVHLVNSADGWRVASLGLPD